MAKRKKTHRTGTTGPNDNAQIVELPAFKD